MKNNFDKTFSCLEKHYSDLFEKYGSNVKTSQQSSRATQIKRMQILTKNISFKKNDKILDFGCGTGYFLKFIKKKKNLKAIIMVAIYQKKLLTLIIMD